MAQKNRTGFLTASIWLGVLVALSIVVLIAYNMNKTALKENERSYHKNLTFLAESTSKSLKLHFERTISEIILLTEVDAIKSYKTKEVDLAFRGVIANRGESISHMILLGDDGQIEVMLTNDPGASRMTSQIDKFFKEAISGWSVKLSENLLTSGDFRGVGLGMPIFRKAQAASSPRMDRSSIYKSGVVMAVLSVEDLVKNLLSPVTAKTSGFVLILTGNGEIIADTKKIGLTSKNIYGTTNGKADRFKSDFLKFIRDKEHVGWTHVNGEDNRVIIDLGGQAWLLSTASIEIADETWTVAVASPRSSATDIINTRFRQSIWLFLIVVVILTSGGFLMTKAQRRWAIAEERALMAETLEEKNRSSKRA